MLLFDKLSTPSKIVITLFAVLLLAGGVVRLLSPENMWICEDGTWVADGVPDAVKPVSPCTSR